METVVQPEVSPAVEPLPERALTVFARNPQEMSIAQAQLVSWSMRKLGELRGEEHDLRDNLEIAHKNGWRTVTLKRQIARTGKRIEFYEKVKAALEAGYCIVPNFPIDVFAVRTCRNRPTLNAAVNTSGWAPAVANQRSEAPALGEGQFTSATAALAERRSEFTGKDGKTGTKIERWAEAFEEVDFPFAFAHPAVLNATQQALTDRIFDELGVSPARGTQRRVAGDPMVIGRIYAPTSARWARDNRSLSFVVAWFLREQDLDL